MGRSPVRRDGDLAFWPVIVINRARLAANVGHALEVAWTQRIEIAVTELDANLPHIGQGTGAKERDQQIDG